MRQCLLQKGTTKQVVWLEVKFAKVGKYLEIQGENGWLVVSVHGHSRPELLLTPDGRDLRNVFESLQCRSSHQ